MANVRQGVAPEVWGEMIRGQLEEKVKMGLREIGREILQDAIFVIPRCPIRTGSLVGSGSCFLGAELIETSEGFGRLVGVTEEGYNPTPNVNNDLTSPSGWSIVIGFNKPYAHRVHEGVDLKFKQLGTGALFLTTKIVSNWPKYQQILKKALE